MAEEREDGPAQRLIRISEKTAVARRVPAKAPFGADERLRKGSGPHSPAGITVIPAPQTAKRRLESG